MKKELNLPGLQKGILLSEFSTFKIGGPADYFFWAKNSDNLTEAIRQAQENKIKFFIIGEGSNILFPDKGFRGLIIKCHIAHVECKKNIIAAGAGIKLLDLANFAAENSLSGLEWAAGIPGSVGGAVFGNAQAFGGRIENSVESVEALNCNNLKKKTFLKEECRFSTKESIFKKKRNLAIISVVLRLKSGDKNKILEETKGFIEYRNKNHPMEFPSAGSIFINSKITDRMIRMEKDFPEILKFKKSGFLPSAWVVEKCGLKGKQKGRAKISDKHANFIVNLGGAKASDVVYLINFAKREAKKKFGILLKEEIIIA
jgi:UDP-N-acetylmuramate dehydrogenase